MFIKTFRKTLALFVAIVFVLSLVPTICMAAEQTGVIEMSNYATTRGGDFAGTNGIVFNDDSAYKTYIITRNNSGKNLYRAYGQFDLSGYEEILSHNNITIEFSIDVGGRYSSSQSPRDFEIYIMSDICDHYDATTITYNSADALGLHNVAENGLVIGSAKLDEYSFGNTFKVNIPIAKVTSILNQSSDNSIITLAFTTTSSDGTFFRANTGKLSIVYDGSLVDNEAYAQKIANGIKWSDLSAEANTTVTQNLTLPSKLYGADISWSSSKPEVINSAGEVNQTYSNESVTLTATATYKGESSSAPFTVTVPKLTYNYPGDGITMYTGTTNIVTIKAENADKIQITKNLGGITGKKSDDYVYNVRDLAETNNYINFPMGTLIDENKRNDIMEFSIYVPTGSAEVDFSASVLDSTDGAAQGNVQLTTEYTIRDGGLYYSSSKVCDFNENEWYNIAYVAPKGMETVGTPSDGDDRTSELYVNGKLVHTVTVSNPTSYGLRTFRFYGNEESLETEGYYLDNLRFYSGEYVASRDAAPSVTSTYDITEKVIAVTGNVTAKQLIDSITKDSDTDLRVYSAKSAKASLLADEAILSDGNILVAATTNGTNLEKGYSTYTIEKLEYSIDITALINGVAGKFYSKSDTVAINSVFENYCAGKQSVVMYVAQYKNGEMIGLWQDDATVEDGNYATLSVNLSDMTDKEGSSLKIMILDSLSLTPYTTATSLMYRAADTTPTLYLLGDSIVQKYVGYDFPIQGWGVYLDNYLNNNIIVDNRATSGWTTDHYLYPDGVYTKENGLYEVGTELSSTVGDSNRHKIWQNICYELEPGDFVMISLGINDSTNNRVPEDRYIENISKIYADATEKGAEVILSTPTISGRSWNDGTSFGESHARYGDLCQKFALANDAVCLPLGETLVEIYNKTAYDYMGENGTSYLDALKYTRGLYHLYAENIKLPVADGGFGITDYSRADDALHLNERGADRIAASIAQLMTESESSIADYVAEQQ